MAHIVHQFPEDEEEGIPPTLEYPLLEGENSEEIGTVLGDRFPRLVGLASMTRRDATAWWASEFLTGWPEFMSPLRTLLLERYQPQSIFTYEDGAWLSVQTTSSEFTDILLFPAQPLVQIEGIESLRARWPLESAAVIDRLIAFLHYCGGMRENIPSMSSDFSRDVLTIAGDNPWFHDSVKNPDGWADSVQLFVSGDGQVLQIRPDGATGWWTEECIIRDYARSIEELVRRFTLHRQTPFPKVASSEVHPYPFPFTAWCRGRCCTDETL